MVTKIFAFEKMVMKLSSMRYLYFVMMYDVKTVYL